MIKQHKSTIDATQTLEYSEGQQRLLCCNEGIRSCPSLDLSVEQAKAELIAKGMTPEDLAALIQFFRNLARELLNEHLRNFKRRRLKNDNE